MTQQKKGSALGFLGKSFALSVATGLLGIYLTDFWVYTLAPGFFNGAARLFPQPIVIGGWTLAYLLIWGLLFVAVGLILFKMNLRKI